jgi:alpha-glucosidase
MVTNQADHWWQRGVIYEVYPRSFADANGDGVGDLPGVLERLDYLVELGVDALWLAPIFPSPMVDFGYDVAEYTAIDPLFGTLADFDALVAAAHARGLRILLDFVPNHTSDQHPWFSAARSSRADPKRDWYLWRDGSSDGSPPNNWHSQFGGAAWTWDAPTGQWYLHSFLREQPDLNWRNPAVREAMYAALRFWLDRGVDGFRVDVLWLLIKDDRFRDNPIDPRYVAGRNSYERFVPQYSSDQPQTHEIVREMRRVVDAYDERVLIGEIYLPLERLMTYYGADLAEAHLPFNFALIQTRWTAADVARIIREYEAALPHGAWPNWVLGNHDQSRIATRVGLAQARVAAMLLLTLRGTPTLYYGEELGLRDVTIAPTQVRDPAEKNQPGIGVGRDPQRTPMPWNATPGGGFTSGKPWLPLGDHDLCNVEAQHADRHSMLNLYRSLMKLRRAHGALAEGTVAAVEVRGDVLLFEREADGERFLVVLNFGPATQSVITAAGRICLSSNLDREDEICAAGVSLRPAEGVIVKAR